jgi:hypothetical protein
MEVVLLGYTFSMRYQMPQTKIVCKMLHPREVDVSTTPIGARKPFGFSSSGVRVLDFLYVKKAFGASL